MDVCTEFSGNPSHRCPDISLKTQNVSLMVALEEKSVDYQIIIDVCTTFQTTSVWTKVADSSTDSTGRVALKHKLENTSSLAAAVPTSFLRERHQLFMQVLSVITLIFQDLCQEAETLQQRTGTWQQTRKYTANKRSRRVAFLADRINSY